MTQINFIINYIEEIIMMENFSTQFKDKPPNRKLIYRRSTYFSFKMIEEKFSIWTYNMNTELVIVKASNFCGFTLII